MQVPRCGKMRIYMNFSIDELIYLCEKTAKTQNLLMARYLAWDKHKIGEYITMNDTLIEIEKCPYHAELVKDDAGLWLVIKANEADCVYTRWDMSDAVYVPKSPAAEKAELDDLLTAWHWEHCAFEDAECNQREMWGYELFEDGGPEPYSLDFFKEKFCDNDFMIAYYEWLQAGTPEEEALKRQAFLDRYKTIFPNPKPISVEESFFEE